MPRFFVNKQNINDGRVQIDSADAHHIARSLRMAEGDEITVSDGEGKDYLCKLVKIRDEECLCEILSEAPLTNESPVEITLCMAYPKGDKLETVIQKAVELGASVIAPFESSRCIKRPKAEKVDKQSARLRRIAEEAAKQCGRSRIPLVTNPLSFDEMLSLCSEREITLFCYEDEDGTSLKDVIGSMATPSSVAVIIGSEGGFSPEEAEKAIARGARSVSLGRRILRCETAPDFVLSALSYQFEL